MVKISTVNRTGKVITLQLEGRIVDVWVVEIRKCCDTLLSQSDELVLDLANVSFADGQGIELLKELQARNVTLINCSPFLAGQIGGNGEREDSC